MNFEQYAPEANLFIKKVASEIHAPEDTDQAYRVVSAVFHNLRDILTPEESLHLISQLPLLVKALYVHDWHSHKGQPIRTMPEFLYYLRSADSRSAKADFPDDQTAKRKTQAVLRVVKMYISPDETEDILSRVPEELLELWATRFI